ncbi:FAD/NAD(P)-binding protein [Streptomyces sp. S.PB5]|uniref:FAD/NAD(P)-binding protein n=1 Tax=Streptomyces sp. S.PB5 TaxID=3020844 RepID=UPI0025B1313E|nr:FAD/NAD(P)-binding protein [Streptomyces sp. S.PB5]MDN3028970.1 FAD/NAD(P)-binding protein [Streptomyces sp. S.PB5]
MRPAPSASVPAPYRVVGRRTETADTATLVLEPVHEALPRFRPGQFAMAYAFGVGEIPLSLSGLPFRGDRLAHTVRAAGAVSTALHALGPGRIVGLRGPFGTGWKPADAVGHDVLVIAGGLGLAPLRPLIRGVLAHQERYQELDVLIGARSPAELLYRDEIRALHAAVRVGLTVDRPDEHWQDDVGVVTTLLDHAEFALARPADAAAFVSGPEAMIRAAAEELVRRGVPARRIQVSLERTMHCGTGLCGHCQLGPVLLCRDGPVLTWEQAQPLLAVPEL